MGTDAKLTSSEVESLAPDASSLKAAKGLVKPGKWPLLAYSEHALWGHCQGSGKNPYVAMVDMSQADIAFKCSCPSRKFPCKHGLALLLNFVEHKDWFTQGTEPQEVTQWLDKRAVNAEKKEQRSQEKIAKAQEAILKAKEAAAQAALDLVQGKAPKTKVKSATLLKREATVAEGVAELKLWLDDCLRNGLLNVMEQRFKDIAHLKKRLVDAKAPGLANLLDRLLQYDLSQNNGRREYLKQMSFLYLIASAFDNRERLSPAWQSEIARLVGIPTPKEEVLASAIIAQGGADIKDETLLVLADVPYEVANGVNHKYFCYSLERQAFVAYLLFVPSNAQAAAAMTERPLVVGAMIKAKVYPYPGIEVVPRVLLEERSLIAQERCHGAFNRLSCHLELKTAVAAMAQYLAQNPFADFYPALITSVTFAQLGKPYSGAWYLCDKDGRVRALSGLKSKFHEQVLSCLALCGGHEFTAVVLLNDVQTFLCGIIFSGTYLPLPRAELIVSQN